jgi:leucyl aminopeptidase
MELEVRSAGIEDLDADVVAVALIDGDQLPSELAHAPGAGDARSGYRKVAVLHPERPARALVVGIGKRDDLTDERLRVAAALAAKRAASFDAKSIAWIVPEGSDGAALVEGTVLASYRFDRYRKTENGSARLERIVLVSDTDLGDAPQVALVAAEAANRARTLQDLPANELTPQRLAERALEIAEGDERFEANVLDRAAIEAAGMGGLVAVSQGSAVEPRLITLRYRGGGSGPVLGLVGKAVTFDSGGISIKPASGMHEMKMDMSGGAAVLEALAAIAELGVAVNIVAAIPATENMPSGTATRPGDVITQLNGKTVEVNNTDAEGRLILADALTYCVRELGAERIVDLATLTGAVIVALGSTYAGLIANDDEWAEAVFTAGQQSGEIVWRLPLHEEYKQLTKGTIADLSNAAAKRKASTIYAGSFLEEFVDGKPWAHLDIAGTAWDTGREYVGKGATGFGVRLLIRLALDLSV